MRAVVYYGAPAWCVPCQRFKPHWDTFTKFYNSEAVTFQEVDVDKVEPLVLNRRGIQGVPTVVVYEDGEETTRLVARTADFLRSEFDKYIASR